MRRSRWGRNKRLKSPRKDWPPSPRTFRRRVFQRYLEYCAGFFPPRARPSSEKKATNGKLIARYASPKPQAALTLISAAGLSRWCRRLAVLTPEIGISYIEKHLSIAPPTVAKSDVRVGARIPALLASEGPHLGSLARSGSVDPARATC